MKRFLIVYTLMSLVILVFIYMLTLLEVTSIASDKVIFELADQLLETKDVSDFIKFRSEGFSYVDTFEDDIYHIDVVHVKVIERNTTYNQLGIFVIPKVEVLHARSLSDTLDLTQAVITFSEGVLYDSSLKESTYPMSYGIQVLGFYFYAFEFDESDDIHITLKDYVGNVIYEKRLRIDTSFEAANFIEGFNSDEIEAFLGIQERFEPLVLRRITIFLSVSILFGGCVVLFLKHRRLQK